MTLLPKSEISNLRFEIEIANHNFTDYDCAMPLFGRTSERDEQRAAAWGDWLRARNPFAIASLVLGVFSLIELGALIIPGIASIILAIIALRQLRKSSNRESRGHGLAWTGIALSVASLIIAGFLYLPRWLN